METSAKFCWSFGSFDTLCLGRPAKFCWSFGSFDTLCLGRPAKFCWSFGSFDTLCLGRPAKFCWSFGSFDTLCLGRPLNLPHEGYFVVQRVSLNQHAVGRKRLLGFLDALSRYSRCFRRRAANLPTRLVGIDRV